MHWDGRLERLARKPQVYGVDEFIRLAALADGYGDFVLRPRNRPLWRARLRSRIAIEDEAVGFRRFRARSSLSRVPSTQVVFGS